MAFVQATVHLARPLVAVLAQFLVLVVWTSVALTAGFFAVAVLTLPEAPRAMSFKATVSKPGTIVVNSFHTLVAHVLKRNAMSAPSFDSSADTITASFAARP